MEGYYLNQIDLSVLWKMSPRTLERWRCEGRGPSYVKIGGKVLYRLEDVLAFEKSGLRAPGHGHVETPQASVAPKPTDRKKGKATAQLSHARKGRR